MSVIAELIEALKRLPGVGSKSAQRMAFHLLERDRTGAQRLSRALATAAERVVRCQRCRTLTEDVECAICANPQRANGALCVVVDSRHAGTGGGVSGADLGFGLGLPGNPCAA